MSSDNKYYMDPLNISKLKSNHNVIKAIGDGDFLEPFSDEDEDNKIDLLNE
jgi:hypothetical protein